MLYVVLISSVPQVSEWDYKVPLRNAELQTKQYFSTLVHGPIWNAGDD
jgi:hypothetical protein